MNAWIDVLTWLMSIDKNTFLVGNQIYAHIFRKKNRFVERCFQYIYIYILLHSVKLYINIFMAIYKIFRNTIEHMIYSVSCFKISENLLKCTLGIYILLCFDGVLKELPLALHFPLFHQKSFISMFTFYIPNYSSKEIINTEKSTNKNNVSFYKVNIFF